MLLHITRLCIWPVNIYSGILVSFWPAIPNKYHFSLWVDVSFVFRKGFISVYHGLKRMHNFGNALMHRFSIIGRFPTNIRMIVITSHLAGQSIVCWRDYPHQGVQRSGKSQGNSRLGKSQGKVREFCWRSGKKEYWEKSGKSQGICI